MNQELFGEHNFFKYLIIVYSIADGQIMLRKSCRDKNEVHEFVDTVKHLGDVVVQRVDHWITVPLGSV